MYLASEEEDSADEALVRCSPSQDVRKEIEFRARNAFGQANA
jgi:hypothetical protein